MKRTSEVITKGMQGRLPRHGGRRLSQAALGTALAAGLLAVSSRAQATVTTTFDASKCIEQTRDSVVLTHIPRNPNTQPPTPGEIKNNSNGDQLVYCPIVRTTSGPTFVDDAFLGADIPVDSPNGVAVTCTVDTWIAGIDEPPVNQPFDNNYREGANPVSSSFAIHIPGLGTTGFWDAVNEGPGKWYYMYMTCTIPRTAGIKDYTITEEGSDFGYRIYPAVSCTPDSSNNILWKQVDGDKFGGTQAGGYVQGQASGTANKYAMDCPVDRNTVIDFVVAMGAQSAAGCNLNSNNFSAFTWSWLPQGTEWPTHVLPMKSTDPFITVPVTGNNRLVCGVNGSSGDGKLLSYREAPQPSRSAWVVSSSVAGSSSPNAVKDNNATTRWTTNTPGVANQWFKIDLGSARNWSEVSMDSATSVNDYARNYRIEFASTDTAQTVWTTAATGTGTGPFVISKSATHLSRYIRIKLTSNLPNGSWWSIHELNVY